MKRQNERRHGFVSIQQNIQMKTSGNLHSPTTFEGCDYLFVADCYVRAHLKRKEKEQEAYFCSKQ